MSFPKFFTSLLLKLGSKFFVIMSSSKTPNKSTVFWSITSRKSPFIFPLFYNKFFSLKWKTKFSIFPKKSTTSSTVFMMESLRKFELTSFAILTSIKFRQTKFILYKTFAILSKTPSTFAIVKKFEFRNEPTTLFTAWSCIPCNTKIISF